MSNEIVTNPTADRPWPAPSPDADWWRGEVTAAPVPPPLAPEPEPEDESVSKALVPVATIPDDNFPLWPDVAAGGSVEAPPEPPAVQPHKRESLDEWPPPSMRASLQTRSSTSLPSPRQRPRPAKDRPLRHLRRPGTGLAGLVLATLLAGFFAWTSAEPFWLAVGHAQAGTAEVTRCAGDGVLRRCIANFTGPGFTAESVTVIGAQPGPDKSEGATLAAQMVRQGDRIAYAGRRDGLHVRWGVGLGLTMLCGVLVAWATGARRLLGRKARAGAVLLSFAGPLLLFAGIARGHLLKPARRSRRRPRRPRAWAARTGGPRRRSPPCALSRPPRGRPRRRPGRRRPGGRPAARAPRPRRA